MKIQNIINKFQLYSYNLYNLYNPYKNPNIKFKNQKQKIKKKSLMQLILQNNNNLTISIFIKHS